MRVTFKGFIFVLALAQLACGIADGIADSVGGLLEDDACSPSAASRRDGNGALLIYQLIDEEGMPEPGMVVVDEEGEELRRIDLPEFTFRIFPGRSGNKALVFTDDDRAFLIDAQAGSASELDIPQDAVDSLIPRAIGYQWIALADPQGDLAFLVDLDTGDVTDLMADSDSPQFAFFFEFSPDEEYVVIFGDELWIVPTADPDDGFKPGEERVAGGSLSCSGELVAYTQRNENRDRFEVVVENLTESSTNIVAVDDLPLEARYIPGSDNLIVFRSDTVSLLSADSDEEQDLLSVDDQFLFHKWFSPNGEKILLGNDESNKITWQLIDLEKRDVLNLDELENFYPRFDRPDQRWMYFSDEIRIGGSRSFASLDLETGNVHRLLELGDNVNSAMLWQHPAIDGSSRLLRTELNNGQQIWLLNGEEGTARVVAEGQGINATLSPNGRWVALSTITRNDDGREFGLELIDIDGDEIRPIGEGTKPISPFWLFP